MTEESTESAQEQSFSASPATAAKIVKALSNAEDDEVEGFSFDQLQQFSFEPLQPRVDPMTSPLRAKDASFGEPMETAWTTWRTQPIS